MSGPSPTLRLTGSALARARARLQGTGEIGHAPPRPNETGPPEGSTLETGKMQAPQGADAPVKPLLTKRSRQIAATLKELVARFPSAFKPDGVPPLPLKIGIDADLAAALGDSVGRQRLDAVLRFYTRRRAYLRAVAAGGTRHDLSGSPAAAITADEQALARDTLARLDARSKEEKAAARKHARA